MELEKTTFEVLGVIIQEPITAVTDLLVSAVCLYAFAALTPTTRSLKFLKYYFLAMALATAYGGIIGHAFLGYVGFGWKIPGWLISMVSIALLERSAIAHASTLLDNKTSVFFTYLNSIELIVLNVIVLSTLNFFYVEAHAAYGLLIVVFSFEIYIFRITRDESSSRFLCAVGISGLAALVHLTGFSLHVWFNHMDLSHVLMAASAYVFFLGGKKLQDTPIPAKKPVSVKTICAPIPIGTMDI
jgi:hypothetical protein